MVLVDLNSMVKGKFPSKSFISKVLAGILVVIAYPQNVYGEASHTDKYRPSPVNEATPQQVRAPLWVKIAAEPTSRPKEYVDTAEDGALKLACFSSESELEKFFLKQEAPFQKRLVRRVSEKFCHIYYEPTLPGFKASSESGKVTGLVFNFQSLPFLIRSDRNHGDAIAIARAVLRKIPRSLDVVISIPKDYTEDLYKQSLEFHFGSTKHNFELQESGLRPNTAESLLAGGSWPQDYLKPGHANGERKTLVARKFYENGEGVQDSFKDSQFVRSKLSFQGGDLFIVDHPKTGQRILLHGNAARDLWGKNLSSDEAGYILMREFGADNAIDFSGVTAHLDYLVSFIPQHRIAILSIPQAGNRRVACSALKSLLDYIGHSAHAPIETRRLNEMLCSRGLTLDDTKVKDQLAKQKAELEANNDVWKGEHSERNSASLKELTERKVAEAANSILKELSPQRLESFTQDLFSKKSLEAMIRSRDKFALEYVDTGLLYNQIHNRLFDSYQAILEGQFEPGEEKNVATVQTYKQRLIEMGYQIVEVPLISQGKWSGLSLTNSLLIDDQLFVPVYGLDVETDHIAALQEKIKHTGIKVVGVPATRSIESNGGVHCQVAIIRDR